MSHDTDHEQKVEAMVESDIETLAIKNVARRVRIYFAHIWEALYTVYVGLSVTVPTFFKKPYTVQYPDVDLLKPWDENDPQPLSHQVSERYRGFLFNDIENCTACKACNTICPVDCITVEGLKFPEIKGLVLKQFDIDYALCIYCGLCIEACPTKCLTFQRKFDDPVTDLAKLYRVFVTEEDHKRLFEKAPRKPPKKPKPETTAADSEKVTKESQPEKKDQASPDEKSKVEQKKQITVDKKQEEQRKTGKDPLKEIESLVDQVKSTESKTRDSAQTTMDTTKLKKIKPPEDNS